MSAQGDTPGPPRVTVVIATYDYAAVLPYSIGSVLDQSLTDFELLVIGDGCTDDSEAVVTGIGDRRVRWINLPENTGHQTGPNNEGLRRAAGEIVAFLGHDDLWLPHHLEVLVAAMDAGAAVAHSTVFYVEPGRNCSTWPDARWSYTRGAWIAPTSLALRRADALAVGGWRVAGVTGELSPEGDIVARVTDVTAPPTWAPQLTCIKLTASKRRDVYKTKPSHEQAAWLAEIRSADDPEAAIRAHIGHPHDAEGDRAMRRAAQRASLPRRAWRSARFRIGKHLGRRRPVSAEEQLRRDRRYKGLR